jgi:hypothetical protein
MQAHTAVDTDGPLNPLPLIQTYFPEHYILEGRRSIIYLTDKAECIIIKVNCRPM